MALCSAKAECCPNGQDQLQFIFGQLDSATWRRDYEDTLSTFPVATIAAPASTKRNRIKKISMMDCNKTASILSTEEMLNYLRLIGKPTSGFFTSGFELSVLNFRFCEQHKLLKKVKFQNRSKTYFSKSEFRIGKPTSGIQLPVLNFRFCEQHKLAPLQ